MLTLCALGVRDAYLISAGLVGLDPSSTPVLWACSSLSACVVSIGLASNEGASTMCSRFTYSPIPQALGLVLAAPICS